MPSTRAKYLSLEQSKELLRQLKADTTFRGVRDYALALFLMTVANHRIKAHELKLRQLYWHIETYALDYGSYVVTLPDEVSHAINRYFELRPMVSEAVFVHFNGDPLTANNIYRIVREWGLAFGVELTPRMLQHQRMLMLLKGREFEDMKALLEAWKGLDKNSQQDACFALAKELVTGLE